MVATSDGIPAPVGDPRGDRRATMRDVAEAAGVSKSLVSLAFREPERVSDERLALIRAAADRLGYRPNLVAGALKSNRGDFVGILVADFHNPLFIEVVEVVRRELAANGRVGIVTSARLPDEHGGFVTDSRLLDTFADLRPSGVVVVGSMPELRHRIIHDAQGPVVVASAIPEDLPDAIVVRADDRIGMRLVVDHLAGLGHRSTVLLGGQGGRVATERAEAFAAASGDAGLAHAIVEAELTERAGHTAALVALERHPEATAFVAANDLAAIGALTALREAGRDVPGDVAVTGYDDTVLAEIGPVSLTSVDTHTERIGVLAVRALLGVGERIEGERLVEPTLVVRRSTAGA